MYAKPSTARATGQLDPLLFPSDTDFRFVLLVVALLGTSLFTYNWLYFSFFGDAWYVRQLECQAQGTDDACTTALAWAVGRWVAGGTLLLGLAAGTIFWLTPSAIIRRRALAPLDPQDAQDLLDALEELRRKAGILRHTTFLVDASNGSTTGMAFGSFGQAYVVINAGLVTWFYTEREKFNTVVLHELGHVRNGDVSKTYLTFSLWRAFVVAGLLPFAAALVYDLLREPEFVSGILWRTALLVALVYVLRGAVLRVREHYADVAAALAGGSAEVLREHAEREARDAGLALKTAVSRTHKLLHLLRSAVANHPQAAMRVDILGDTTSLFPLHMPEACAAGLAAAMAAPLTNQWLSLLLPTRLDWAAPVASAAIVAAPMVGVVGIGIWRSVFASTFGQAPIQGLGRIALGLALGIAAGMLLSLDAAVPLGLPMEPFAPPIMLLAGLLLNGFLLLLLLAGIYVLLRWTSASARAWSVTTTSRRSLLKTMAIVVPVVWVAMSLWLGLLHIAYTLGPLGLLILIQQGAVDLLLGSPLTALVLAGLWLLPLAAVMHWPQPLTWPVGWALAGEARGSPMARRLNWPGGQGAVRGGVLGGGLFAVLLIALSVGVRIALPETARATDSFLLAYWFARLALAILVQAAIAATVAAGREQDAWVHGLAAASLCGSIETAALLIQSLLLGGALTADLGWMVFTRVVNGGAVLSIASALVAAAVVARRRTQSAPSASYSPANDEVLRTL